MYGIWVKSLFLGMLVVGVNVSASRASICDAAAQRAAIATGVPVDVLLAITRLETGRGKGGDPWPWTVNHAGDGSWFQSEDDARSYVFSKVKRGVSNIDIGCFQINYRWHAGEFRSLDDMFNPDLNALYAGQFLTQLYREFGNWTDAAGAYHSRTPEYAERYKSKFRAVRDRVADLDSAEPARTARPRVTIFGQAGTARAGSVFLTEVDDVRPFIQFNRTN